MNIEEVVLKEIKKLTRVKFDLNSTIESLNIDSLDLVILVSDIEKKYNINILDDEELNNLKTVDDIVKLFAKKINK
ncbi:acyl carrier protein [Mycoplasma phocoeninasale]|uniref:Acyl carrier protein n=1 Tax=Mycoplasma phocoeninasale TaxID=2726117 RepID=A0A858U5Z3_9MOLU|nr:phosphopantetheine-binding protein [Mycoplasma phocoeninasale]QJG66685.1 acyl carrier protein [Mycoplasma phocoeninasale]